jgi:hypothetical protein
LKPCLSADCKLLDRDMPGSHADLASICSETAESVFTRRPNTVLRIASHTNLTQSQNSDDAVTEGCV